MVGWLALGINSLHIYHEFHFLSLSILCMTLDSVNINAVDSDCLGSNINKPDRMLMSEKYLGGPGRCEKIPFPESQPGWLKCEGCQ